MKKIDLNVCFFVGILICLCLIIIKYLIIWVTSGTEMRIYKALKGEQSFVINSQNQNFDNRQIKFFQDVDKNLANMPTITTLTINPLSDYDYLTKDEVLNIRKKYIETSLFKSPNYIPSEDVFGSIEKAPWYGTKYSGCVTTTLGTKDVIEGPSEESRFINNPNMLVGLISGAYRDELTHPICTYEQFLLLPKVMLYNNEIKTFSSSYKLSYDVVFDLVGINARDLGYKYVYADKVQNISFTHQDNISTKVHEFRDYIHKGGSCRYESGCNNGSPYQPEIEFRRTNYKKPSTIHLKLWREKPISKFMPADINYIIRIRY